MTFNQIIAEFTLQQIKKGDLVEVQLSKHRKPVKGFILHVDVFHPLSVKFAVDNAIYKGGHKQDQVIEIRELNEKPRERIELIPGLISLFQPPIDPLPLRFHISEIISIIKVEK